MDIASSVEGCVVSICGSVIGRIVLNVVGSVVGICGSVVGSVVLSVVGSVVAICGNVVGRDTVKNGTKYNAYLWDTKLS